MEEKQPSSFSIAGFIGLLLLIGGAVMTILGIAWAMYANTPTNRVGNDFYGIGIAMGIGGAIVGAFFGLLGLVIVVLADKPRKIGVMTDAKK